MIIRSAIISALDAEHSNELQLEHIEKYWVPKLLDEIERLQKVMEYARHKEECALLLSSSIRDFGCDCGFDEVMK